MKKSKNSYAGICANQYYNRKKAHADIIDSFSITVYPDMVKSCYLVKSRTARATLKSLFTK